MIIEQAAHNIAAAPLISAAMAADLIARLGSDEQRETLLPAIMSGELVVACALDEAPRHNPTMLKTVVDDLRITGRKTSVIDGMDASRLLVSAQTNGGVGLFLVDPTSSVCIVEPIAAIDARNLAVVSLDATPCEALSNGDAGEAIAAALDLGRALLAAELLGLADHAFDMTIGYLKERKQFDRIIGTYQALQHRAARLYARLDLARGLVLKALRAIDEDAEDASELASLSKCVMTQLARDVLAEAVQMHGGIGVTDEFDLGLYFKRARVAGDLFGDDRFHAERLAREKWGL